MAHSFKHSLQKEILHRSSLAAFGDLIFTPHSPVWFFLFPSKATTHQGHSTDCPTCSEHETSELSIIGDHESKNGPRIFRG